jgi:crossover junction endodeoxyribonuclease RuvC
MVILGIDPGSKRIGYGIIEKSGSSLNFLSAGILSIRNKNLPDTLTEVKSGVDNLIRKFRPGVLAIEKLYFVKNQKTALSVAEARGVIILSASQKSLKIKEFSPNEVKSGVAGYGLADKKAIAKMVSFILKKPLIKVIDDATDALAIAIVAAQKLKLDN